MEVPSWSGCSQPLSSPSHFSCTCVGACNVPCHSQPPRPVPLFPLPWKIILPPFYSSLLRPLQSSRFSPAITSSLTPGFPQHLGLDISLPSSWKARAVFCISVSLVSLFSSWTGLRKSCGVNGWTHEVDILFSLSKKKWMAKSHYTLLRVLDCGWAKVLPL